MSPIRCAGVKWISSFPENIQRKVPRASALLILNSLETGFPEIILEGSIISAQRTAASAALAAKYVAGPDSTSLGIVGCGPINSEIARYVKAAVPSLSTVNIFDTNPERAEEYARKIEASLAVRANIIGDTLSVLEASSITSFATNRATPHIERLPKEMKGKTILHVSLRDLSPEAILANRNIVDDVDHVCRAQTSIHLAEKLSGIREFIAGTIAGLRSGRIPARLDPHENVIVSPFGLGVLDIAVGAYVAQQAKELGCGITVEDFFGETV